MSENPYAGPPLDNGDERPDLNTDLHIDEPPITLEDTKPKAPVRLSNENGVPLPNVAVRMRHNAVHAALAAEEPPIDSLSDTAETLALAHTPARALLLAVVMLGTACLCLMLVSFAGFAGYRDGLATNDVKITQTLATGIAEQYATGVADLEQGYAELAAARFGWIVETVQPPTQYALNSAALLATARAISSYTPTPPPMPTENSHTYPGADSQPHTGAVIIPNGDPQPDAGPGLSLPAGRDGDEHIPV